MQRSCTHSDVTWRHCSLQHPVQLLILQGVQHIGGRQRSLPPTTTYTLTHIEGKDRKETYPPSYHPLLPTASILPQFCHFSASFLPVFYKIYVSNSGSLVLLPPWQFCNFLQSCRFCHACQTKRYCLLCQIFWFCQFSANCAGSAGANNTDFSPVRYLNPNPISS